MAEPATHQSELVHGAILGGKYRLENEIGRGAMGTVWSAIHEKLGQRVAIKIISQEHAGSEELTRRFDTEARAAAKLRSRFVVGVTDNGETRNGLPYIVMEYLEGECLEDRIARKGCIPPQEVGRIARHVSRALSKAHSRGIVHRDLKPANIFISKSEDEEDGDDWTAKVLDFGIAKMDDFGDRSTTKTGTVLGTPLFMSPEQVRGASNVDARADLYSFGMVVFNMLTGTYAFEGQSFGDLLVSICTDPLPNLSRSAPHAPPALNTWFQKACARDPAERYQTADEFMDALAAAMGDTTPGRQSYADITGSQSLATLAATYTAESSPGYINSSKPPGILQAGTSGTARSGTAASISLSATSDGRVDTGTSAHTVHALPEKSKLPYFLGAGAACLLVGGFVLFSGGETKATQAPAVQVPAAPIDLDETAPKPTADSDPALDLDADVAPPVTAPTTDPGEPDTTKSSPEKVSKSAGTGKQTKAPTAPSTATASTTVTPPTSPQLKPVETQATPPQTKPKTPKSGDPDLGF